MTQRYATLVSYCSLSIYTRRLYTYRHAHVCVPVHTQSSILASTLTTHTNRRKNAMRSCAARTENQRKWQHKWNEEHSHVLFLCASVPYRVYVRMRWMDFIFGTQLLDIESIRSLGYFLSFFFIPKKSIAFDYTGVTVFSRCFTVAFLLKTFSNDLLLKTTKYDEESFCLASLSFRQHSQWYALWLNSRTCSNCCSRECWCARVCYQCSMDGSFETKDKERDKRNSAFSSDIWCGLIIMWDAVFLGCCVFWFSFLLF